jgi:hypothetical protein
VVAVVTSVALVAPTAALACNGGVSAVNVYKECLPNGGGGKSHAHKTSPSTNNGGSGSSSAPAVSGRTAKVLKHAGKDRRSLAALVGTSRGALLQPGPAESASATTPSAVGSAFDLGSGPTALLIVLAGTAALLLGGSGLRLWHHRRP